MARLRNYNTGSGALSVTLNPGYAFDLEEVRLHLNTAATTSENFTVDIDSNEGAQYDTQIFSQDMATIKDLLWQPDKPIKLVNGDQLVFAWTNTDGRTWGLEVIYTRQSY
jgi:hypothetical protein